MVYRGQEVARAWPVKGKKALHPATKERNELFRQVQWAFKFTDTRITQALTEAVKKTPLLPRDLFLSGQAGRSLAFYTPEGRLITSVAAMRDVSETLDSITSLPGSILVRTADFWVGLNPGDDGHVMTMNPATHLPQWLPPTGAGGGAEQAIPAPGPGLIQVSGGGTLATTVSLALLDVWPQSNIEVSRVMWPATAINAPSIFKPVIYDWGLQSDLPNATTGATLVATGPDFSASGKLLMPLALDAPYTLEAGRLYLIGMHKRGSTGNTSQCLSKITKRVYSSTAATGAPPNPLPALTQSDSPNYAFWTE